MYEYCNAARTHLQSLLVSTSKYYSLVRKHIDLIPVENMLTICRERLRLLTCTMHHVSLQNRKKVNNRVIRFVSVNLFKVYIDKYKLFIVSYDRHHIYFHLKYAYYLTNTKNETHNLHFIEIL